MKGFDTLITLALVIAVFAIAGLILGEAEQSQCLQRNTTTGECIQTTEAYSSTLKMEDHLDTAFSLAGVAGVVAFAVVIIKIIKGA